MEEENSDSTCETLYLTKCLDFIKQIGNGKEKFYFNINIGNAFKLTVNHSDKVNKSSEMLKKKGEVKMFS